MSAAGSPSSVEAPPPSSNRDASSVVAPQSHDKPGELRFHVRGDSMIRPFSPALVHARPLDRPARIGDVLMINRETGWMCHRCLGRMHGRLLEKGDNNVTARWIPAETQILLADYLHYLEDNMPGPRIELLHPAPRRWASMLLGIIQRTICRVESGMGTLPAADGRNSPASPTPPPDSRARPAPIRDRLHNIITRTSLRVMFPRRSRM